MMQDLPLRPRNVVIFGGGNALGSYLAGAYEEMTRQDVPVDWIIGASIGAVTGAIIAGNPPERRLERLREFWAEATTQTTFEPSGNEKLRQYYNGWHAALVATFGRPSMFTHRWPGFWGILPGPQNDVALYDHRPLAATLARLVDFDFLNRSDIRLTVACVDIETGDEVVFDTSRHRIGPEHILASTAITPAFPPVLVDGRMLCDPGYVNNSPVDLAFAEPFVEDARIILLELFSLRSPRPASLDAILERTQDILFASPTRKAIEALKREYALRLQLMPDGASVSILHMAYRAAAHELSLKTLDFSPSSVADRWAAGASDLRSSFAALERSPSAPGLTYISAHQDGAGPPSLGQDAASRTENAVGS